MSPPRRRSARLASSTRAKSTPDLKSVAEHAEPTTREPSSNLDAIASSPPPRPATPASSALKPSHSEMHPSKAHQTMAAPSPGLDFGFTDVKDHPDGSNGVFGTPTRTNGLPASPFTFSISRDAAGVELSGEAQRLMNELRDKASAIKAELVAQREAEGGSGDMHDRKIATPKGKTGRFSAAHMAEFKKMDSIEGHASAWRAQNGRFTPTVSGTKRSATKANLDTTPIPVKRGLKRSPSKAQLDDAPSSAQKANLKSSASMPSLRKLQQSTQKPVAQRSPLKTIASVEDIQQSPSAKRFKKRQQDDTSDSRPVSQDGSSLPRPKSSSGESVKTLTRSDSVFSRLASPTKSSMAHSSVQRKPTISLVGSPSAQSLASLTKSATTGNLASPSRVSELKRRIISPNRFQRVKSILRGSKTEGEDAKTALPKPAPSGSQTPAPARTEKALPPLPLTTPRRKLSKHVSFTPEIVRAARGQNSPSPLKSMPSKSALKRSFNDIEYPALDGVLAQQTVASSDVFYPDLSQHEQFHGSPSARKHNMQPSVPGKFTFRSDHTIQFGPAPSAGFGASAGQASLRHVRGSILPTVNMPGSFPAPPSPSSGHNKENQEPTSPQKLLGAAHGILNKKRHRPSWEEEEADKEAAERASKKRKNEHVPEGPEIVAPRLAKTPNGSAKKLQRGGAPRSVTRTPGSASPTKKKPVLSASRLNMLARPKIRN